MFSHKVHKTIQEKSRSCGETGTMVYWSPVACKALNLSTRFLLFLSCIRHRTFKKIALRSFAI
jgi:hypothetical protein